MVVIPDLRKQSFPISVNVLPTGKSTVVRFEQSSNASKPIFCNLDAFVKVKLVSPVPWKASPPITSRLLGRERVCKAVMPLNAARPSTFRLVQPLRSTVSRLVQPWKQPLSLSTLISKPIYCRPVDQVMFSKAVHSLKALRSIATMLFGKTTVSNTVLPTNTSSGTSVKFSFAGNVMPLIKDMIFETENEEVWIVSVIVSE